MGVIGWSVGFLFCFVLRMSSFDTHFGLGYVLDFMSSKVFQAWLAEL